MVDVIVSAESLLIYALIIAIIAQAVLSWFMPMYSGKRFMVLLREITDPILIPIRQVIPPFGMLDLSPFIAILLLQFLVGPVLIGLTQRLAGT